MNVPQYLERNALNLKPEQVEAALDALQDFIADLGQTAPSAPDEAALYRYPVPALSEDGSCSLFDALAPEPYALDAALGGRSPANTRKLWLLNELIATVHGQVGADWLGVYQRCERPDGPALVKLAYRGLPSRAEFPLTAAFAAKSNNSQVGLSGKGLVIHDVAQHAAAGGSYYVCDPKVKSEVCLPIIDDEGTLLGIIDAEADAAGFFTDTRLVVLTALSLALAELL